MVYSLLLARRANKVLGYDTEQLQEKESIRLGSWVETIQNRRQALSSWVAALADFRKVLAPYKISRHTLDFWNAMARRAVAEPATFADDPEIQTLTWERERYLKRRRARLSFTDALENWGGGSAANQLDYRWGITKSYLGELAAAEDGS